MDRSTIVRALRRSRVRVRTLLQLFDRREAYPADLAHAAGVDNRRLLAVMHGEDETYRPDLALVTLGLAEAKRRGRVRVYAITPLGEAVARELREHYRSFFAP